MLAERLEVLDFADDVDIVGSNAGLSSEKAGGALCVPMAPQNLGERVKWWLGVSGKWRPRGVGVIGVER
jgi:hypothetical protein